MASIDSGEFKLMRNINVDHQPSRSEVYNEWIKVFIYNLPEALANLNDVLDDIAAFKLWEDQMMTDFFEVAEKLVLENLSPELLAEHAKTIKEIKAHNEKARTKRERRGKKVRELYEQGLTQQQIADQLGVSQRTISSDLEVNSVRTPKTSKEPRKFARCEITEYTKPETAAQKIRQKLGDKFADELKRLL